MFKVRNPIVASREGKSGSYYTNSNIWDKTHKETTYMRRYYYTTPLYKAACGGQ